MRTYQKLVLLRVRQFVLERAGLTGGTAASFMSSWGWAAATGGAQLQLWLASESPTGWEDAFNLKDPFWQEITTKPTIYHNVLTVHHSVITRTAHAALLFTLWRTRFPVHSVILISLIDSSHLGGQTNQTGTACFISLFRSQTTHNFLLRLRLLNRHR